LRITDALFDGFPVLEEYESSLVGLLKRSAAKGIDKAGKLREFACKVFAGFHVYSSLVVR
jgi:hypothetical protein